MIKYNKENEYYECICEECNSVVEIFATEIEAQEYEDTFSHYIELNRNAMIVYDCCLDEFVFCDGCDEYHYACEVNMYRVGYDWYCEESAVEAGYYGYCANCGELVDMDYLYYSERRDAYYCEDCYPSDSIISDWHDHKGDDLHFNKADAEEQEQNFYFGIELEIDKRTSDYDYNTITAETIRDEHFNEDEMYFEEDGSLWGGFELITHPMSYDFIQEKSNDFKDLCNYLDLRGYTGENNKTAGLHIHVSRENISEEDVKNIIYFLENNLEDMLILSRRGKEFGCYAKSYCFNNIENYKNHKEAEGDLDYNRVMSCFYNNEDDRYRILNTTNYSTIEFRLFKSTLNSDHLLATIDFINTLVNMAIGGTLKSWHSVEDIIIYSDSKRLHDMYIECQDKYND